MKEIIGFAGLGIMGRPMARNILNAGYKLLVYDVNPAAIAEVLEYGAVAVASPKNLAQQSDIIVCMLPDAPQILDFVFGKDGLKEGLSEGKLLIDMSTTDAGTENHIHEQLSVLGVETLDAPVSGGQPGAISGSLSIMAGGSREAFQRALPLFEVLGKKINLMGGHGAGQITKSCSQIATALATQGIIEAFSLARSAGIELSTLREALLGGFAESRALAITGEKIIKRDFQPGFKLELYRKDLSIAKKAGAMNAVKLPGTELVFQEMETLLSRGKGMLDFSALIQVFESDK